MSPMGDARLVKDRERLAREMGRIRLESDDAKKRVLLEAATRKNQRRLSELAAREAEATQELERIIATGRQLSPPPTPPPPTLPTAASASPAPVSNKSNGVALPPPPTASGDAAGGAPNGEASDEGPPRQKKNSRSITTTAAKCRRHWTTTETTNDPGWSADDWRIFTREIVRWWARRGGKDVSEVVRRVWAATSGRVGSEDEVERRMKKWLREKERRAADKDKIRSWRAENKAELESRDHEDIARKEDNAGCIRLAAANESREAVKKRISEWRDLRRMTEQLTRINIVEAEIEKKIHALEEERRKPPRRPQVRSNIARTETEEEEDDDDYTRIRQHLLGVYRERNLFIGLRTNSQRLSYQEGRPMMPVVANALKAASDPTRVLKSTRSSEERRRLTGKKDAAAMRLAVASVDTVVKKALPKWRENINWS